MEAKKASLVFDILNGEGETINGLLANDKTIFEVPIYQRNYDWSKKECEKLFGDIMEAQEAQKNNCKHFTGTIIYISNTKDDITTHTVIDGQQRLTTIYILLKAVYDSLKPESSDLREKIVKVMFNSNIKDFISEENGEINFKKKTEEYVNKSCKLKLIDNDDVLLKKLIKNNKNEIDKIDKKDKSSNIYKNYEFFEKKIKKIKIENVLDGIKLLEVVEIILDKNDKPQDIFESINSTGLPLSLGDLTKNYLLMNSGFKDSWYDDWIKIEENVTHDKLSKFVICFLNSKSDFKPIPEKDAYREFKKYCEESTKEDVEKPTKKKVLEELLKVSKYYGAFFATYTGYSEKINKCLEDLRDIKKVVVLPFLFRIFNDYENGQIVEITLCKVLKYLLTYFVRTKVCDTSFNISPLEFMVKMYDGAFKKDYENYYHDFAAYLNDNKDNKKYRMPKDKAFREKLINNNLYTPTKNSFCRFVLLAIENPNNDKISKKEPQIEPQIEHYMPQTLTDAWKEHLGVDCWERVHETYLHKLGNLTLTWKNRELGNQLHDAKKKILEDEAKFTILNDKIVNATNWNETTITERAEALSKELIGLFQYDDKHHLPKVALENTSFKAAIGKVLSGCKVYKFFYNDNEVVKNVKSWSDLLYIFLKEAYYLKKTEFDELATSKFEFENPHVSIYKVEDPSTYKYEKKYTKIIGDIFVNYKGSQGVQNIVKFMNDLLIELKLPAEDFGFSYSNDTSKLKINVFYNTKSKDESSSNIEVFTGKIPVKFLYKNKEGVKEVKVTTWPNLLKEFLNVAYELNESEIENLAVDNLSKTGKSLKIYKKKDKPAEAKQIKGSEYYYAIITKDGIVEERGMTKIIPKLINELVGKLSSVKNSKLKIFLKEKNTRKVYLDIPDTWMNNTTASLFHAFFENLVKISKITKKDIDDLEDTENTKKLFKRNSLPAIKEISDSKESKSDSTVKSNYNKSGIKFEDTTYYTYTSFRDEDKEAVIKWYKGHLKQEV